MDNVYKTFKARINQLFEQYRLLKYLSEGISLTPEQQQFVDGIEKAVRRLPAAEKAVIEIRYLPLDSEYGTDYEARHALGISDGTFQRRRYRAFVRLGRVFIPECSPEVTFAAPRGRLTKPKRKG